VNWRKVFNSTLTLFAAVLLFIFLVPLAYMIFTSLKTMDQMTEPARRSTPPSRRPTTPPTGKEYPVYRCQSKAARKNLALVTKGRKASEFVDPNNPTATSPGKAPGAPWIGRWSIWAPAWSELCRRLGADQLPAPVLQHADDRCLRASIGTLLSCILVAYGFSRFRFPGRDISVHHA
jgi:multiple sugar transport system permease protein